MAENITTQWEGKELSEAISAAHDLACQICGELGGRDTKSLAGAGLAFARTHTNEIANSLGEIARMGRDTRKTLGDLRGQVGRDATVIQGLQHEVKHASNDAYESCIRILAEKE